MSGDFLIKSYICTSLWVIQMTSKQTNNQSNKQTSNHTTPHHNRFTAIFPGPSGWAGARRELLDFMVQGKINRGRHTDHPAGCHSIQTNPCPPPPSPIFYRPDALPAAQPTVSKHSRKKTLEFSSTVLPAPSLYLIKQTCKRTQNWDADCLTG